jgi:hypothetical protein
VIATVKLTLEAALQDEVSAELSRMSGERPRRSGYFQRGLDTQYGHIVNLHWLCCPYVMGLSLRDLQEALYFLVGHVLSRSAVNQVTLEVQK